jgi:uncharacterized protein YkwD
MRPLLLLLVWGLAGARSGAVDAKALTDAHNRLRARHCAPPLAWSTKLAASAQQWAGTLRAHGCAMQHSGGPHGENLAGGTAGLLDEAAVVNMWYDESRHYNFKNGGFSMKTGHFTQVVWRTTTQLGCAVARCPGIDVWVCQYDPPGNVQGAFRENVLPTGCH